MPLRGRPIWSSKDKFWSQILMICFFQPVCSEVGRGRSKKKENCQKSSKDCHDCKTSKDCNDDCQHSDDCKDCHPDDCIFNTSQHIKDVSHQHKLVRMIVYLNEPSRSFRLMFLLSLGFPWLCTMGLLTYGSDSPGQGFWPKCGIFLKKKSRAFVQPNLIIFVWFFNCFCPSVSLTP